MLVDVVFEQLLYVAFLLARIAISIVQFVSITCFAS